MINFFSISSCFQPFFDQCKNTIGSPLSTHCLPTTTRYARTRRMFSHRCPWFARCFQHTTANRSSTYHLHTWYRTFTLHTTSSLSCTTHHHSHHLHPRNLIPHCFFHRFPYRFLHPRMTEWRLSKKKPKPRLWQQHRERPSDATKRNWIVLGESSSSVATAQSVALSTKVTMYVQERPPMSSNGWSTVNLIVCLPQWRLNDNRPRAQLARFFHWPSGPQSPVR